MDSFKLQKFSTKCFYDFLCSQKHVLELPDFNLVKDRDAVFKDVLFCLKTVQTGFLKQKYTFDTQGFLLIDGRKFRF